MILSIFLQTDMLINLVGILEKNSNIQDLENSIQYLPSDRQARVSKWAAMSYLAKINFQKHDYEQALYWCNEVIQSNEFSLNSSVKEIYDLSNRSSWFWGFTDK